jgi:hypothetical protein
MLIAACVFQAVMLSAVGSAPIFFMFSAACLILGFGGGFIDTYCNSSIVDVWKSEGAR